MSLTARAAVLCSKAIRVCCECAERLMRVADDLCLLEKSLRLNTFTDSLFTVELVMFEIHSALN